jgi:hypothetical protein
MEIGQIMDSAALMMNTFVRYNADYSRQYLYADVYETECYKLLPVDDPDFGATMVPNVHPTHAGHEFMAEQIIKVLPERGSDPAPQPDPKPSDDSEPQPSDDPAPEFPFKDVQPSDWFYDYVYYVWDSEIMKGVSTDTFAPQAKTTRAQFATVLYRMADSPDVTDEDRANCHYGDLKADWYRDAVIWAYGEGVVKGISDTVFDPDAQITREQMVTMLYRYAGETAKNTDLSAFTDSAAISEYARPAVAWAVENAIVNGMGDGTFQPKGNATRAQLAAILTRYMTR